MAGTTVPRVDVVLTWPAVDERRARLAEGWCPAQGHPALAVEAAAGTCPQCGLTWTLRADVVTVRMPEEKAW